MKLIKKIREMFKLVPTKKLMLFSFLTSSILGYIIMAYFPYATSQIIKYATIGVASKSFKYALLLGLSYIIYEIIWYINYYVYSKLQTYYCDTLHHKFYEKIANSSSKFMKQIAKSKMLSLVGDDIPSFCLLIDSTINFASSLFMFVFVTVLIFKVNILSAIIILISSILYIIYVKKTTEKFTEHLKEQKKHNDAINKIFIEELNGLKELKTLPIKNHLEKKLDIKLRRYTKAYFKKRKYYQRNENSSTLFPHYTKFLLYLTLLAFMVTMNLKIEIVILIIGYYDQLTDALDEMLVSYEEIEEYYVSVERVSEVLTYQDDLTTLFGNYEGDTIYGSIVFKNVSYKYNSKYILDNISFEIKPNTLTAIVGDSGSGKTSILNLMLRFYKLNGGEIFLDGRNIYDYSSSIYASNITLVKQSPFIYNMSIDNNLKLVNSNKKRIREVCKEVGIDEFIMSLKKGYKTVLNQNARNISGGQKQLLAIARALLTEAEVLLMDDVTSSLDPKTTNQIIKLLQDLIETHTIIVTTNREDLINVASQIIYLHNGKAKVYKSLEELKEKTNYESKVN